MLSTNTGSELLRLARRHLGEPYVLGIFVPKDNAHWRGPWDCAEFASWLVYQLTGRLYGCADPWSGPSYANAYSGAWANDARRFGRVISVAQAVHTPGAVLLRMPSGEAMGHLVISDGWGGAIEAHSPEDGVIAGTSLGRPWDFGVLVPGISYTPTAYRSLRVAAQ